jgi:flagellin-like hook-associated protein FlgL
VSQFLTAVYTVTVFNRPLHTGSYEIYGQRYDSSGNQVGGEFQINTNTANDQTKSSITALSDGGFVVTWQGGSIYGQRYDSSGNQVGGEFMINNTNSARSITYPSTTALSDGGFVVAWESSSKETFGKRYDSSGNQVGGEFQINTNTADHQGFPSITGIPIVLESVATWQESSTNIQTSLDELTAAKERLRSLQEKLSTNMNIITTRSSFTDSMVNILETGADNLTNADMNEEGANALMLQTQQTLGTTSLSMAAQAAQSVLRLFN